MVKFYIAVIAGFAALLTTVHARSTDEFSDTEKAIIQSLSLQLLPVKPASHSNKFANDVRAQQLGAQLFFDKGLSANNEAACSTCHQPDKFFTDGLTISQDSQGRGRNTPTLIGSAWLRWFYWDGRKDSLWSQALSPIEALHELGSNRLAVVRYVAKHPDYQDKYEEIFGPLPDAILSDKLPENAGPFGNQQTRDNWDELPLDLKKRINNEFANIGKALAAYQRTLNYEWTRFDTFASELASGANEYSLDADEIAGLKLFIDDDKTQCLQCHNGPLFTNRGFHNVGTGILQGDNLDFGRMIGIQAVIRDEFNCLGIYSNADADDCSSLRFLNKSLDFSSSGAFKTPSLRSLAHTSPYFHDGRFSDLRDVIAFYNNPPKNVNHELQPMNLTNQEINHLLKFLSTISNP